jgi:hypothetical protein
MNSIYALLLSTVTMLFAVNGKAQQRWFEYVVKNQRVIEASYPSHVSYDEVRLSYTLSEIAPTYGLHYGASTIDTLYVEVKNYNDWRCPKVSIEQRDVEYIVKLNWNEFEKKCYGFISRHQNKEGRFIPSERTQNIWHTKPNLIENPVYLVANKESKSLTLKVIPFHQYAHYFYRYDLFLADSIK